MGIKQTRFLEYLKSSYEDRFIKCEQCGDIEYYRVNSEKRHCCPRCWHFYDWDY